MLPSDKSEVPVIDAAAAKDRADTDLPWQAKVWFQIATLFIGALTALGTAYIGYLTTRVRVGQERAADRVVDVAEKAEAVKETLVETTAEVKQQLGQIQRTGKETHTLVNSNMEVQLELTATALEELARETGKESHRDAAKKARMLLESHIGKQAKVDAATKPNQ